MSKLLKRRRISWKVLRRKLKSFWQCKRVFLWSNTSSMIFTNMSVCNCSQEQRERWMRSKPGSRKSRILANRLKVKLMQGSSISRSLQSKCILLWVFVMLFRDNVCTFFIVCLLHNTHFTFVYCCCTGAELQVKSSIMNWLLQYVCYVNVIVYWIFLFCGGCSCIITDNVLMTSLPSCLLVSPNFVLLKHERTSHGIGWKTGSSQFWCDTSSLWAFSVANKYIH